MGKSRTALPNRNHALKVQVATWSADTGKLQCELAKELGITAVHLSRILNGHADGREWLDRIAEITKVNKSA